MAEKRKLAHVPGLKIMPGTIRTVGNTIHVPKPWKTLANKQKRKLKKKKEKKSKIDYTTKYFLQYLPALSITYSE